MDALPQAIVDSAAGSPVLGAIAMLVVVLSLHWIRAAFPALLPGGSHAKPAPAHEGEPARGWQFTLQEAEEGISSIGEILRTRNDLARREAEAIERVERLLIEILAAQRAQQGRGSPVSRPRPSA